jgi:hypothetical protein
MSALTRGKKRDQTRLVKVVKDQNTFYQFDTKDLTKVSGVSATDIAALGHINPGDAGQAAGIPNGSFIFYRANAPKPPRVTKLIAKATNADDKRQQSIGTFCAVDQLQSALGSGWSLAKPARGVSLSNTNRTVTALAELSNGILYAFPMNADDFATYGGDLGLKNSTTVNTPTERAKVVRASSLPRPGKASKILDDGSRFTSFYSTNKNPAGYSLTSEVLL